MPGAWRPDHPPPPDKLGEDLKLSYIARFCDSPESLFLIQNPLFASAEIPTRARMRLRVKFLNLARPITVAGRSWA